MILILTFTLSSKMEDYLGTIATYLSNLGKVLKTLPSSEKSLVRQGLSSASRRKFFSQSAIKKITTPQSDSKSVPFVTGEDGQLLPGKLINSHAFYIMLIIVVHTGVLLYFSDGLIPLLRAYYRNFFQKSMLSRSKVTFDIATALLVNRLCFICVILLPTHFVYTGDGRSFGGTFDNRHSDEALQKNSTYCFGEV